MKTSAKQRKPGSRTLRWEPLEGYYLGRLTVKQGGVHDAYLVRRLPADWGIGFELDKLTADGPTVYHVNLDVHAGRGADHSCSCPHATYRGHVKPCRHLAALLKLRERGQLS
jgi:hypothetical protein